MLSQCGDGFTDTIHGEQCDFGTGFNGAGTGCETNCRFSCAKSPDSCPDANICNGAESCGDVTVNEDSGAYSAAWATALSTGPSDESGQKMPASFSRRWIVPAVSAR